MKLQTIHNGRVLATAGRSIYLEGEGDGATNVGRLPAPAGSGIDFRLKTTPPFRSLVTTLTGRFPAVNVWSVGETLLASADRWLFRSTDDGRTWSVVRTLPASSAPMGVLPSAVCVADGSIYLGEYPLDGRTTPRILESDDGAEWSTVTALDGVRHVHAVQTDPYTGDIWVTTGDADAECRIGRLRDGQFEAVGSGDQSWRAVELAFTPSSVLWGVDSVYEATKPIQKLSRNQFDAADPRPETVHEVSSSVYYAETLRVDGDRWVLFSTSKEAGTDSTGPDSQTVHSDRAAVVAASSASEFTDWHELAAYRKRTTPVDRWNPGSAVPMANAYVFLAADPSRGVLLNPYNTDRDDGTIQLVPHRQLSKLTRDSSARDSSGRLPSFQAV
ncbi:glycosyl hydrolase [Natrarchaeobius chitinivorans]|uniref:Glycosyl hydrolase n=1 Tax=Natrarchaeobius chitinivorans TaxID=1679083 RepID=A0A3N6M1H7_NATCH|nr:glycosyl hydrolase [Natrarchaeobius chitinivorans]RQG97183.1 glycosyl hydrolase [Natrarchaeobius chitinivorans]